jgi:osmotically-inducible protein OsmY
MLKSATSLDEQLSVALSKSPVWAIRNLHFEANDGHVILDGVVDSYYQKQMAQEVVRQIQGVRTVENNVRVQIPHPRLPR